MGTELVIVSEIITPAAIVEQPTLPVLVERAGPAARDRLIFREFV
jgi:hypothetical protein